MTQLVFVRLTYTSGNSVLVDVASIESMTTSGSATRLRTRSGDTHVIYETADDVVARCNEALRLAARREWVPPVASGTRTR